MPPAAISRSSTYFPKICGNIACRYRSAFGPSLLGLGFATLGCGPLEPENRTLEVRAHSLAGEDCAVPSNANIDLRALGPFPVSPLGAARLRYVPEGDEILTFPDDTHGVEAFASDGNRAWLGYSDRLTASGLDVLLLEASEGCVLAAPDPQNAYPETGGGQAFGYSAEAGVLLVAGGDTATNAAGESLFFDTGTGVSIPVPPELAVPFPLAHATATPFGSGLILAGGEDPTDDTVPPFERHALQTAEYFDPATRGFDGTKIDLQQARTRHAAVRLPNGETLLVGGSHENGTSEPSLVTLLEAISPETRRSHIAGLTSLAPGRIEPSAIVLTNGRILVGGGYDADGPVERLQWLSPDGSCTIHPETGECATNDDPPEPKSLERRHHRAFVALPGGGALSVGGCAHAEKQTPACIQYCGEGFGCPAPTYDAVRISPEGARSRVTLPPTRDCGTMSPERALLAPGSDGSAWLFAYDEDVTPPCRAVFRFDPWSEAFVPAELRLPSFPDPRVPLTSLGPDVFVWLGPEDPPTFMGLRAGNRGPLSQNETSLLVPDPDAPLRPVHLSPDRALVSGLTSFSPLTGLKLDPDDPATVSVTDTRYDDVGVTIEFEEAPPLVLFGDYAAGGEHCGLPEGRASSPLSLTRTRGTVTLADGAGRTVQCGGAPEGELTLAVRAGTERATLRSLIVKRR